MMLMVNLGCEGGTGSRKPALVAMALAVGLMWAGTVRGADWPQYRGPSLDGRTPEQVASTWPAGGLRAVWRVPTTGGFSVFSVLDGRAFTLMVREIDGGRREVCVAFDALSGNELWAAPLGPAKYDGGGDSGTDDNKGGDGPRSTPTVEGDRVYVLDSRLQLYCLDAATGQPVWTKDLVKECDARNIAWQSAASPLLDGDRLFICCGAEGGSLLALNKSDGSIHWKAESDKMTHASPVAATIHGVRQVIFFTQAGLVSAAADSGKVLWRYPFRYSVSTAASPVVSGDIVYCSAGYGVGSAAVRIEKAGDGFKAKELWRLADNRMANHWSTPVLKDGYLYGLFGFKEYGECPLKCVELATGKEKWAVPGFGPGGVVLAGDRLLALNDRGALILIDPRPERYREMARMQVVKGKCWNHPVLANGRIFARSTQEGVCLEALPATAQTSLTIPQ